MSPGFRLPPQTASLHDDWRALHRAAIAATTPDQHAAVALRWQQLADRLGTAWQPVLAELAATLDAAFRSFADAAAPLVAALTALVEPPAHHPGRCPSHAQRGVQRQHGPPQRRRPPRTIGRPSSGARR